jgi:hypothetical protein
MTCGHKERNAMATIVIPTARSGAPGPVERAGLTSLEGKTVGFLNNGWACMDTILGRFDEVLKREFRILRTVQREIPLSSQAPASTVAEIARESDFVVVGLAN